MLLYVRGTSIQLLRMAMAHHGHNSSFYLDLSLNKAAIQTDSSGDRGAAVEQWYVPRCLKAAEPLLQNGKASTLVLVQLAGLCLSQRRLALV